MSQSDTPAGCGAALHPLPAVTGRRAAAALLTGPSRLSGLSCRAVTGAAATRPAERGEEGWSLGGCWPGWGPGSTQATLSTNPNPSWETGPQNTPGACSGVRTARHKPISVEGGGHGADQEVGGRRCHRAEDAWRARARGSGVWPTASLPQHSSLEEQEAGLPGRLGPMLPGGGTDLVIKAPDPWGPTAWRWHCCSPPDRG